MSRQEHSALLIAGLATLSLLLTLAACTEVVTSTPTSSPTPVPTVNPTPTPTPTMTPTPSPPRPTPKSLAPPVPTSRVRDIPLPHEPCTPSVDSDFFHPRRGSALHFHAGFSPEEHRYFDGKNGVDSYDLTFHYEFYEHFVAWTQSASHVVFDIDDTIWTLNVESAELNEIADVDSDYMRLDGSTTYPQRMAYGFYGDVSPDGSHIVYSTCEYRLPGSVGEYGYELGITGVDGTGKRRLTNNTYFEHYPVWSPDGSKVAFLRNGDLHDYQDGAQLSIMTVDTAPASLTATPGQNQSGFEASIVTCPDTDRVALIPPVWSPDGYELAFVVHEGIVRGYEESNYPKSYAFVLYTIRPDCSGLRRIGETTTPPVWSPDGRYIAYGITSNDSLKIHIVDDDGGDARTLWHGERETKYGFYWRDDGRPARSISQLSWSPDGAEILFVSDGVHTVQTGIGQLRTLVDGSMRSTRAAWSPDGLRVAIHHPGYQILTVARDGSDARIVMELPVDATSCSNGNAIYNPRSESTLVEDCIALLGIRNHFADRGVFLPWSTATHIKAWPGVRVCRGSAYNNEHRGTDFVCALSLRGMGLTGSISSQLMDHLTNLSLLEDLDLSDNNLEGVIPPEFGCLKTLRFLNLNNNRLEGEIPPELGELPVLMVLNLSNNGIEGEIPAELGDLPILFAVYLSNTKIEGEIPPELGNLMYLARLDLSFTNISGSVPPELASIPDNAGLNLEGTNLSGCLPPELPSLWLSSGLQYCVTGEADNS